MNIMGARGGGKSFVTRPKAITLALKYDGIRILFLRRTLPDLKQNHYDQFQSQLNGIAKFNQTDNRFIFPNGSIIQFGYFATESDWLRYQGQAYQAIFMDEATQFTETQFMKLKPCLRLESTSEFIKKYPNFKPRMYLTANPGGVGHMWVKRLFIDRIYNDNENPDDYKFIQALVFDNDFLMKNNKQYVDVLMSLPEKERQAMLYGDWNVFEGQYFDEFREETHTFDPDDIDGNGTPFKVKQHWRVYRTRDFGLDKTACYWCALDENDTFWIYEGLWQGDLTAVQSGREINRINEKALPKGMRLMLDICPPDLWNRQSQTGKSVADVLSKECNQFLTKANNDRVVGHLLMKEFMQISSITGKPKIMISQKLIHLIESVKMIQHDEKNPNDCAKDPHEITHSVDAIRYLCTSFTFAPDRLQEVKQDISFDYARFAVNMGEFEDDSIWYDEEDEYIKMGYEGGWFI